MAVPRKNRNSYRDNVNTAAEIFEKYGDFIRSVIYCQVADANLADDLFQDFFLSLASKPPPCSIKNIRSYLYKSIINDIIDSGRRVERYQAKVNRYSERICDINKNSPEDAIIMEEQTDKAFEFIKGWLSTREAEAIDLRYKDDYSIKEVAAKMKVDSRTVSRYISAGLGRVRRFFRKKTRFSK